MSNETRPRTVLGLRIASTTAARLVELAALDPERRPASRLASDLLDAAVAAECDRLGLELEPAGAWIGEGDAAVDALVAEGIPRLAAAVIVRRLSRVDDEDPATTAARLRPVGFEVIP